MKKDTVVSLKKPVEESDPLTGLLREGARQLLHEAVEAELADYLSQYQAERDAGGRRCVVRNGYLPARTLLTGVGRGAYSGAEDAGPARPGPAFHLGLVATVYQAHGECGERVAVVVFEGGVHGGHERGVGGVAGGAGEGFIGGDGESVEAVVGAGVPGLVCAGFTWPAIRVRVGGWDLLQRARGGCQAVFTGRDWGG